MAMDEADDEAFTNEERHFARRSFLDSMGGMDKVLAGEYLSEDYTPVSNINEYPDLMASGYDPTRVALKRGGSPISLFFLFMPMDMRQHITECSNFFMHEQLEKRVDAYFEKKEKRDEKDKSAGLPVANAISKSRRDVHQDLLSAKPVLPHEICVYIWLLCARTKMPNCGKPTTGDKMMLVPFHMVFLGDFWRTIASWTLVGTCIFNSNQDPRAKGDHAWKIRPVVTVLQETFVKLFVHAAELSFDEAMLPSRSSYNRTLMYMKEVGHQAIYVLLCALCFLDSIYCGHKQHIVESGVVDMKSGPAAVFLNLRAVFGDNAPSNATCRRRSVLHFHCVDSAIIDNGFLHYWNYHDESLWILQSYRVKKEEKTQEHPARHADIRKIQASEQHDCRLLVGQQISSFSISWWKSRAGSRRASREAC
ncbi:hypothetical protein PHMEG_00018729 [Phytophthora megakarya]|uniref:PiggyBac transposable element-derived protein domain-containing protein n=1 Tax=Phytophthora megakarya TaxID=4795 RepID=A0A225VTC8_9STRA|nr:hypothetical protein PHMEG_00018729 [Phytophthora megakarya]